MDEMLFIQVIPRLRVWETRLLDKTKIDRMIDAPSAQEALKVLQETEYASSMNNIKRAEDYEIVLRSELKRVYNLLYSTAPIKEIIDIMSLRYDYHNMKTLIKAKLMSKDLSYLLVPIGTMNSEKLKSDISNEYYDDMRPIVREAVEKTLQHFSTTKDPQTIDVVMDGYMLKDTLITAQKLNNDFITKYVKSNIDLTNIRTLIRVKKQNKNKEFFNETITEGGYLDINRLNTLFIDSVDKIPDRLSHTNYSGILRQGIEAYNRDGNTSTLEKLSDNYLMGLIKDAKLVSFGPEPLLAYLVAKETEIRQIRIVMVGKINNVSSEFIRERLRDVYV